MAVSLATAEPFDVNDDSQNSVEVETVVPSTSAEAAPPPTHRPEEDQSTDEVQQAVDNLDSLSGDPASAGVQEDVGDPEESAGAEGEAAGAKEIDAEETEESTAVDEAEEDAETHEDEQGEQDAEDEEDPDAIKMDWYILKVQSNRERSIADALRRKIAIEGLDEFFDDVVVPTEKVTEFKGGKKKVVERKLYPGYIVVHMHINDDTWFAVRETSGIGDFTGSGGKPTPMLPHEVSRIIHTEEEETDEAPKLDIKFKPGDAVKIKEGTFEGFEGEVNEIDAQSGKIKVLINIFGRSTPVELEYWQVENA